MQTSPKAAKETVVLFRPMPRIDQEFATCLALKGERVRLDDVQKIYYVEDGLPGGVQETIIEVDAAKGRRYIDRNQGSATMCVALDYGFLKHPVLPGLEPLLEMLRDNNGKGPDKHMGGFLKRLPWQARPFPWLLALVQKVPVKNSATGEFLSKEERVRHWIAKFQRVCDTYFRFCETHPDFRLSHEAIQRFTMALPELSGQLSISWLMEHSQHNRLLRQPKGLLTLSGYLIARYATMTEREWLSGGAKSLEDEHAFWESAFMDAVRIEQAAEERAEALVDELIAGLEKRDPTSPIELFDTPAGRAAYVLSDMDEFSGPFFRKTKETFPNLNILIVQKRVGNAAILTRVGVNVDTGPLARTLQEMEPDGRWHDERRFGGGEAPSILNGSKKIPKPPTALRKSQLKELARKHLRYKARR